MWNIWAASGIFKGTPLRTRGSLVMSRGLKALLGAGSVIRTTVGEVRGSPRHLGLVLALSLLLLLSLAELVALPLHLVPVPPGLVLQHLQLLDLLLQQPPVLGRRDAKGLHTHTHARTHTHTHTCGRAHIHTHTGTYTYTQIQTHAHTNTHFHDGLNLPSPLFLLCFMRPYLYVRPFCNDCSLCLTFRGLEVGGCCITWACEAVWGSLWLNVSIIDSTCQ